MSPECCACASAERLRRPSGVSEQWLLGAGGCDHPHEALWTPGPAQHLHPGLRLRGLDQEGHGDGLRLRYWRPIRDWTNPLSTWSSSVLLAIYTFFFSVISFTIKTINNTQKCIVTSEFLRMGFNIIVLIKSCITHCRKSIFFVEKKLRKWMFMYFYIKVILSTRANNIRCISRVIEIHEPSVLCSQTEKAQNIYIPKTQSCKHEESSRDDLV